MKRSIFGLLAVASVSILLLLFPAAQAYAGNCCKDPALTCTTDVDCLSSAFNAGPCGPPCGEADHLKCYRIKDPLKLLGVVDLDTPQFGLEPGCVISRPFLFCAPASKKVRKAVDFSTVPPKPIDPLPIFGPPAPGDRICYRIFCPAKRSKLNVKDQFGARTIERRRPFMLCTPAVKEPPPPCGDTFFPECNGECPPGETCENILGTDRCECMPEKPGPCSGSFPECNGECPAGETCEPIFGTPECKCMPTTPEPCVDTFPQCGGVCPNPDEVCVASSAAGICECQPPTPLECGQTFPQCNGTCPPNEGCVPVAGATCHCLAF